MTDDSDEYLDTDDEDGSGCYHPRRSIEEKERIRAKQEFELRSAYRRSNHRILQANSQAAQRNLSVIRLIPEPSVTPVAVRKRQLKQKIMSDCPFINYEAIDIDAIEADCSGSDSDNSSDATPIPDDVAFEEDNLASQQKSSSKSVTKVDFAALSQSTENFESDDSSDCLKKGPCVRRGSAKDNDGPIGNQKGRGTGSVHTDDSFESDEDSFISQHLPVSRSATSRLSGRRGTATTAFLDSDANLESDEDSVFG
jgi:hypothetical protein